jgi:hypothetical protein
MKLVFSRQIFQKRRNIKFHENQPIRSRVLCGKTDGRTAGQRDTTNLIVAFRDFSSAPKKFTVAGDIIYTKMTVGSEDSRGGIKTTRTHQNATVHVH